MLRGFRALGPMKTLSRGFMARDLLAPGLGIESKVSMKGHLRNPKP